MDTDEVSGLYIDATKKGNWTRFVNNSHDPNAQFEPVIIGGTWRIFMVAIKRIKPGEEVTIDYGREYRAPDQKFVQCFCSSTRCSGVIGVPMDKKAITKLLLQDIHYQDDDLNILCGENRVLEAQNKQLRKQIAMIKPMFNNLLDEVFIPITDHRPEDVRLNNSRVVREFLNDQEVTLSVRDVAAGPLLDNDVTTPSGSSRSTTDPRPTVAAISGTGRRSSTRSSKRSAEPDRTVADDGGVGEEGDEGHRVEVTPPSKKRRTSPRLSVQKIPGCMIESTISGEADEKGTTSCDEAKSPSGSRRASTQPPPIPVVAVRVEDAVDEFYRINVGLLEEDDDDIIDVTPEATRALPAPGPSSGTSAVSRKPIVELKRHKSLYTDQIIDWYKAMTLVRAAEGSAGDILPCPIHKKDKLRKMREVRKHFFLSHAGAANTYKEQLEKRGKSLSDSETTLFQDSQKIRNGT